MKRALALGALLASACDRTHGAQPPRATTPAPDAARAAPAADFAAAFARFRIVAHRGGAAQWPEETLLAYESALAEDPDVVLDGDVHLSRDGVPVLIHDATLDRTTNGTGPVGAHTAAELAALDAAYCFTPAIDIATYGDAGWANCHAPPAGAVFPYRGSGPRVRVLTLAAALDALPAGVPMNLELKDGEPGAPHAVAQLLRAYGRVATTCVGAFDRATVDALVREFAGDPRACVFGSTDAVDCLGRGGEDAAACERFAVLEPSAREATPSLVARAHARGTRVIAWTVNDEDTLRAVRAAGVDGVFTNVPRRMRAALGTAP